MIEQMMGNTPMLEPDSVLIGSLLKAGKRNILLVALILVMTTAFLDWAIGRNVSLAALYILPMMVAAVVLRPPETAAFALVCAYLRFRFDTYGSPAELTLRFIFATLAYFLSGLFVTVLIRNRELVIQHLGRIQQEQALRREAEEQLRLLADSSPATILTTDRRGVVLASNRAADALFSIPEGQSMRGRNITSYLPVLGDALRVTIGREGLRTAVQCQGYRENGEIFLAHIWFSSYLAEEGERLAAIVVDSSEEMREREEEGLLQLMRGNRIAAAAVAHEVHNSCVAMTLLCSNLQRREELARDEDMRGVMTLLSGLQAIASLELQAKEEVEPISLKEVLDSLRIITEPAWQDIDGIVRWTLPPELPQVFANRHGLLQAFLNLTQNSNRAVQEASKRELLIRVQLEPGKVLVRFNDSGPGIPSPENLFQPLQQGAIGAGMGLYVSRFSLRGYGGDLRCEPTAAGSCFVVELQAV
jgi:nitrogen-specific signal transduction histidine kinase